MILKWNGPWLVGSHAPQPIFCTRSWKASKGRCQPAHSFATTAASWVLLETGSVVCRTTSHALVLAAMKEWSLGLCMN